MLMILVNLWVRRHGRPDGIPLGYYFAFCCFEGCLLAAIALVIRGAA